MQITITGQNIDVTAAIREHVNDKLDRIVRHVDNATDTHIVLHVEKTRHLAEATVNVRGASIHASSEAEDMYTAIDQLAGKLDRRILKHKEKNTDHHQNGGALKDQSLR
jgi:putative sigma-54 modulation protein